MSPSAREYLQYIQDEAAYPRTCADEQDKEASAIRSVVRKYFARPRVYMQPDRNVLAHEAGAE